MKYIYILLALLMIMPTTMAFTQSEEAVIEKISTETNLTNTESIILRELLNFTDSNTISNETQQIDDLKQNVSRNTDDIDTTRDNLESNISDITDELNIYFDTLKGEIDEINSTNDQNLNNDNLFSSGFDLNEILIRQQQAQQQQLQQQMYCDMFDLNIAACNNNDDQENQESKLNISSQLSNYYTKDQIDNNFVNEDDFPKIPDTSNYVPKSWFALVLILLIGLGAVGVWREKELNKKIQAAQQKSQQPVNMESFKAENYTPENNSQQ